MRFERAEDFDPPPVVCGKETGTMTYGAPGLIFQLAEHMAELVRVCAMPPGMPTTCCLVFSNGPGKKPQSAHPGIRLTLISKVLSAASLRATFCFPQVVVK